MNALIKERNALFNMYNVKRTRNYKDTFSNIDEQARIDKWDTKKQVRVMNIFLLIEEHMIIEHVQFVNDMRQKLNNLTWLNEQLLRFGRKPQANRLKATQELKKVYINIYDLLGEGSPVHATIEELREYTYYNDMVFPLDKAKDDQTLTTFLQKLKYSLS